MKSILSVSLFACLLFLAAGCHSFKTHHLTSDIYADPSSDAGITADAMSRLNNDSITARSTLGVRVVNGTATLSGMVPNEAVRQRAISILNGTPGVITVDDRTVRQW